MKEISIIVHDDQVEGLVEGLHETGLIEIVDVNKSGRNFVDILSQSKAHETASKCADLEMQLNKLIEILGRATDAPAGGLGQTVKGFLSPSPPPKYEVKPRSFFEVQEHAEKLIFELEPKVTNIERKLEEISEELALLAEHKRQISILAPLDFMLEHLGVSDYLVVRAGTTPDEERLRKALGKVPDVLVFTSQVEKKLHRVVVVAHKKDMETLDSALKGVLSSFSLPRYKGTPTEALEEMENRIKTLRESRKSIWDELKGLRKEHLKEMRLLREEISIFKARGEALSKFGKTENTSVITGWAAKRDLKTLEELVESETGGFAYLYTSDPEDTGSIPIYTRNPRWARPFEMLTEMFAVPHYHEVDPTIILTPIFVMFFGLMLGDAIYGALVLLVGLLIYKGQGKISKSMHDMGIILSWVGFSSIIFGVVQGSYLGPLTEDNPLTALLVPIGAEKLIILDSMNNPIPLLVLALIIGLIHLNMGLILAVVQNIRRRAYEDILLSQVSWFFLQYAGVVVFGAFFGWFSFPVYIKYPSYICGIIGLAFIFLQKGEEDAEGNRKRKGPLGFFDLTGFIGNWLSYARILALGLATAGIAMTVNIIASLIKSMFSGIGVPICASILLVGIALLAVGFLKHKNVVKAVSILLILIGGFGVVGAIQVAIALILLLIFIAGHLINAVLQALGAFIHALRLQYVEFFGQFYSGGGKKFSPFIAEREHTVLERTEEG